MRVLSIDPGYGRCGVAVVDKHSGKERLVASMCIETDADADFYTRLGHILKEVDRICEKHSPDVVAIEKLYFNTNKTTAMRVSEVRGAIAALAIERDLPIYEYTPLEIKNAVTGYGKSSKHQMIDMLHQLIEIEKDITHDDEYDAIAVGLTHLASQRGI